MVHELEGVRGILRIPDGCGTVADHNCGVGVQWFLLLSKGEALRQARLHDLHSHHTHRSLPVILVHRQERYCFPLWPNLEGAQGV